MDATARIAALERKIARLQEELVTDPLTRLYNRRGLEQMLALLHKEVSYQLKNPEKRRNFIVRHLSVVFIDIDHFKNVNTNYGHPGGDAALATVARAIKGRVRGIDIVGRYGGEEMVVGLVGADHASATEIANDIRKTVEATDIIHEGEQFRVTVSCGVATLNPDETLEILLKRADDALYEAKNTGRNRVVASTS